MIELLFEVNNSGTVNKNPYQQSIDDKELIVDKVVLINKDP